MVFSDLSSARLSTQKNRLVTLSGELLEASGAITGGSKLNKDLAYSCLLYTSDAADE